MAFKLAVDHPDFPKGFPFDCDGILVENGSSVELTKEQELLFQGKWGNDVKFYYSADGPVAKLTGSSELSKKERDEAFPEASGAPIPEEILEPDKAKEGGE